MTNEGKSILEKTTGNIVTQSAITALSAYAGTPLAALLPVLLNSLAQGRHTQRVENTLREINRTLCEHESLLKNISDSQYQIINEAILSVLQTTENKKITFLKKVIEENLKDEKVTMSYAIPVSRIIRDISANELQFLIDNYSYARLVFSNNFEEKPSPIDKDALFVEPDSEQGAVFSGLISMGLIITISTSWDDVGRYQFSPLVSKVIATVGI